MYEDVLKEMSECMIQGGEYIELMKDAVSGLWVVSVRDEKGIYYGYTLGKENKDFLFALLEFCDSNKFRINVNLGQ